MQVRFLRGAPIKLGEGPIKNLYGGACLSLTMMHFAPQVPDMVTSPDPPPDAVSAAAAVLRAELWDVLRPDQAEALALKVLEAASQAERHGQEAD